MLKRRPKLTEERIPFSRDAISHKAYDVFMSKEDRYVLPSESFIPDIFNKVLERDRVKRITKDGSKLPSKSLRVLTPNGNRASLSVRSLKSKGRYSFYIRKTLSGKVRTRTLKGVTFTLKRTDVTGDNRLVGGIGKELTYSLLYALIDGLYSDFASDSEKDVSSSIAKNMHEIETAIEESYLGATKIYDKCKIWLFLLSSKEIEKKVTSIVYYEKDLVKDNPFQEIIELFIDIPDGTFDSDFLIYLVLGLRERDVASIYTNEEYLANARKQSSTYTRKPINLELYTALDTLGFNNVPGAIDLKQKKRLLAKQYHPDLPGGDLETMQAINSACTIVERHIKASI